MSNPIQFIKEARVELTKVVWPSKETTFRITLSVVLLCIATAIFLGSVDFGLTQLVEWFLSTR